MIPSTDLAAAEKMAVDWAHSVGVTSEGATALEQLRALPTSKLLEGTSGSDTIAALSPNKMPAGMAMSIIDGGFLPEPVEAALEAGRIAPVATIIGSNDHDLGIGSAQSKDELFALFGAGSPEAKRLYDPRGDQTLDELKQQVFADRTMTSAPIR